MDSPGKSLSAYLARVRLLLLVNLVEVSPAFCGVTESLATELTSELGCAVVLHNMGGEGPWVVTSKVTVWTLDAVATVPGSHVGNVTRDSDNSLLALSTFPPFTAGGQAWSLTQ